MHDSAITDYKVTRLQELRIGICRKVTETVCLQPLKAFADIEASLFQFYVLEFLNWVIYMKKYRIDRGDDEPPKLHLFDRDWE